VTLNSIELSLNSIRLALKFNKRSPKPPSLARMGLTQFDGHPEGGALNQSAHELERPAFFLKQHRSGYLGGPRCDRP
jgi:hypothetical protein